MSIALYRIDDRLIHGQVVVGWGVPLRVGFIVVVDDAVADAEWEQDLYRMGVPPQVEVIFASREGAGEVLARCAADARTGIVLTGDIAAMRSVVDRARARGVTVPAVNVGGIHHRDGRVQHLRYVFLTPGEREELVALASSGVTVSAQDVPSARAVPLDEMLRARAAS